LELYSYIKLFLSNLFFLLFKLALNEIYSYLNAYIQLNQPVEEEEASSQQQKPEGETAETQTDEAREADLAKAQEAADLEQKRAYLLFQIQKMLNDLTVRSSSTLTSLANAASAQSNSSPVEMSSKITNPKIAAAVASNQQQSTISSNSITNFRNETILCANCYGDLFVI
jgi:hypothetical protein